MASTDPLMTAADGGGTVTLTEHTLTLFDGSVAFYKTARGDESKITCFGQNVLGVSVREASKVSLVIHAFDRAVPGCCGGDTTKRTQKEYEMPCENAAVAQSVADSVRKALGLMQRKMLVLINPFGGGGKAPGVWRKLAPLLEMGGVEAEVIATKAAGHAKEIAQGLELGKYDALISVSGDGLVNEIVNGLMSRPDGFEAAARTPLCHAPGGTGNGLFKSICHKAGEAGDLVGLAFVICKGVPAPLDLWSYVRPASSSEAGAEESGEREVLLWSVLSFSYGLISDVDIESEVCRCCGPLRLTMYGLLRIANRRQYTAKVMYLDAATDEWVTVDTSKMLGLWACNVPYQTETDWVAPQAEFDNGVLDMLLLDGTSRCQGLTMFLQIEDGKHLTNEGLQLVKAKAFKLFPQPRKPNMPGWLDVDGEVVPFGDIEARPHPRAMRVLLPPASEAAV